MSFVFKNGPETFQRIMDRVFTGLQETELFSYLCEIVLYADSLEEYAANFNYLITSF